MLQLRPGKSVGQTVLLVLAGPQGPHLCTMGLSNPLGLSAVPGDSGSGAWTLGGSARLEVRAAGLGAQASFGAPSGCRWLLCLLRGVGEVQHQNPGSQSQLAAPPSPPRGPFFLPPPVGHALPPEPPHLTALVLVPTPLDQPLPWAVLQAEGRQAGPEGRPALGWIQDRPPPRRMIELLSPWLGLSGCPLGAEGPQAGWRCLWKRWH